MTKILAVCTGNVCRSPYVERRLAAALGPDRDVVVRSAGTHALVGSGIDGPVAAILRERGIDPEGHTAVAVTPGILQAADLILAATRDHRLLTTTLAPATLGRTIALADLAQLAQHGDRLDLTGVTARTLVRQLNRQLRSLVPPLDAAQSEIVDPYGAPAGVAAQMADQVDGLLTAAVPLLDRVL